MKRTTWATALLLATLMIIGFGCSTDKSSDPGRVVGSVQVVMDTDTLKFVPGDSAVSRGFIVVSDRDGLVMPGVPVSVTMSPVIGFIEWDNVDLKDTTAADGRVRFIFRSFAQPGNTVIKAAVGNVTGSWSLWVRQASEIIESLTLQMSPKTLWVSPSSEDSAKIIVSVKDSNSVGIPGVSVQLQATGGRLKPIGATDSTGRAETWWYNNREFGMFFVTGRISNLTAMDTVTSIALPPAVGSLVVRITPVNIQADGCISKAQVIATLRDQYSTPVTGDTIKFSTPYLGSVLNGWRLTDSSGIARTEICEFTTPSADLLDSAYLIARYTKWALIDTARFFIQEASRVERIDISASPAQGIAGVDSATLAIRVYHDSMGTVPVNGLTANLWSSCGSFNVSSVKLISGSPEVPIRWKFCDRATNPLNPAKITVAVGHVVSDTFRIDVNPGPARNILLIPDSYTIPRHLSTGITAFVRDSLGNLVRSGIPVSFSTTRGTLSPVSPILTNDDGTARVTLTPVTAAGQAIISANVDSLYFGQTGVNILPGGAASIELTVPFPSPQVRGTGGVDRTLIIADVKDANGNAVQDGQWVYFTIIGSPPGGGATINQVGLSDSAQTAAGSAQVTFNSGTVPGPVNIRACTIVNDTLYCVNATNISIVAGPPASIIIQPTDVGVDVGPGVAWDVSIGALVGDLYNNPVRDGIAVYFELDAPVALVVSDTVVTGNGPRRPGVAMATIRYPSDNTFQHVNVTAYTAEPNSVIATKEYILPLQTPSISLNCQPPNWNYAIPNPAGTWCLIACGVIIKDGHNRLINGATVIFSTTRGRFWTTNARTLERYWNKTGPEFGFENGYTQLILSEQAVYIFPPNSTEITADVQAEIQGTGIIDGAPINFRQ